MKNKFALILTVLLTAMVCAFPGASIRAATAALKLCADALLPSLFVFFVLSGLLVRLGLPDALEKPFSHLCRPLFGVNGSGAAAVILGFVSGYPVGTVCVKNLYQNGQISKTEAARLLAFCNNSGPLFVLGTVGTVLLGSAHAGRVLYACHALAAVSVGIAFRLYKPHEPPRPYQRATFYAQPLSGALADSVQAAIKNILYVCGFTVLFAVLLALLPQNAALSGILEITNGCRAVAKLPMSLSDKMRLTSLVMGFGGISVHLQIAGILADTDLSAKTCLIGKVMQAVISYIYVFCFVR